MGSCPSSFRGQFTPNHDSDTNGTANIVMKPVDENDLQEMKVADNGATNGHSNDAKITEKDEPNDVSKPQPLIVDFVDVCAQINNDIHQTSSYYSAQKLSPKLIARRGSPFKVDILLNREFKPNEDILCLVFTSKDAKNPSYSQGTQVFLPIVTDGTCRNRDSEWRLQDVSSDGNNTTVQIVPAANTIVGEWYLEVDSRLKNESDAVDFHYKVPDPFLILFNPWCANDSVYLSDSDHCKEYVLNDSGLVWRGSHNCLRPCIWNYGQFEENVLECCLYLLTNVGRLPAVKRSDPVRVVRHLSSVLNARDKLGVLVGNWSGKYKGGQSPTAWTGSYSILQAFYKTKKPVKFGQCWVFAGLFTTVCRALGIPSRPVTNYSSAHDVHDSLTVDLYFDQEGRSVDKLNLDSIWNFHLWTEVWMARPDLEPGECGGWQAVDAVPQDQSDGTYQCGPASVAAIKRGDILKGYDTKLLYAEVNADKVYWRYNGEKEPLKLIKKASSEVGQCISTKAIGKFEREDITEQYKHAEGSKGEREVMLRTLKKCRNAFSRYYMAEENDDLEFQLQLVDDIIIGETFTVKLIARSPKPETPKYTVNVSLRVDSALYTGDVKKLVKKDDFNIVLGPEVEETMTMVLEYSDYERALVEQCAFIISATAHVKETGFDYCQQDDFRVRMPDVSIQVDGDIVQNQPVSVTAFFTNPLPKPLHNGIFVIEGPGFDSPLSLKCKGETKTGADARVSGKLIPRSNGFKVIAAKYTSKELNDVDGYHEVQIKPAAAVTAVVNDNAEKKSDSQL